MEAENREELLKITPVIILTAPKLLLRLLATYLRFRGRVDGASKEFRNSMVREGVPGELADILAKQYSDENRFMNFAMNFARNPASQFPK